MDHKKGSSPGPRESVYWKWCSLGDVDWNKVLTSRLTLHQVRSVEESPASRIHMTSLEANFRNCNHSDLPPRNKTSLVDEFCNEDGFGSGVCVGGMIEVRVIRVRVVRLVESKFNASWVVLFAWAFVDLFLLSRTFALELEVWCFRIQPVDLSAVFICGWDAGPLPDSFWKHP